MEENIHNSTKSKNNIFWTGISNENRNAELEMIKTCIDNYGFIVDYHFFSDLSASLTIEIEERKIEDLYKTLSKIVNLSEYTIIKSESNTERTIYLNITFTKGTGDLKVEVPAVPG